MAELTIISANGMREVIADTRAAYEAASGRRLAVTVVETGAIRRRCWPAKASTSSWCRARSPRSSRRQAS